MTDVLPWVSFHHCRCRVLPLPCPPPQLSESQFELLEASGPTQEEGAGADLPPGTGLAVNRQTLAFIRWGWGGAGVRTLVLLRRWAWHTVNGSSSEMPGSPLRTATYPPACLPACRSVMRGRFDALDAEGGGNPATGGGDAEPSLSLFEMADQMANRMDAAKLFYQLLGEGGAGTSRLSVARLLLPPQLTRSHNSVPPCSLHPAPCARSGALPRLPVGAPTGALWRRGHQPRGLPVTQPVAAPVRTLQKQRQQRRPHHACSCPTTTCNVI